MRVMDALVNLVKLEGLLGLYADVTDKLQNFKLDKFIFKRYKESADRFNTSDAFIECEIKRDNMYTSMRKIYFIIAGISELCLLNTYRQPTNINKRKYSGR
jgi:hypothetical protein